jgi:hypothetical protein
MNHPQLSIKGCRNCGNYDECKKDTSFESPQLGCEKFDLIMCAMHHSENCFGDCELWLYRCRQAIPFSKFKDVCRNKNKESKQCMRKDNLNKVCSQETCELIDWLA